MKMMKLILIPASLLLVLTASGILVAEGGKQIGKAQQTVTIPALGDDLSAASSSPSWKLSDQTVEWSEVSAGISECSSATYQVVATTGIPLVGETSSDN